MYGVSLHRELEELLRRYENCSDHNGHSAEWCEDCRAQTQWEEDRKAKLDFIDGEQTSEECKHHWHHDSRQTQEEDRPDGMAIARCCKCDERMWMLSMVIKGRWLCKNTDEKCT